MPSGRADGWVEIAEFGGKKLDFLRQLRAFAHGTPSHDPFGNLFAALDTEAFQNGFIAWVAPLTKLGSDIVAIDGKTPRRSYQEDGAKAPIHMISARSARHGPRPPSTFTNAPSATPRSSLEIDRKTE